MRAPCYGCRKRHFKCHAECEDYKAFVDERETMRAKRKQNAEFVCYLVDKQTQKERLLKRKKGRKR